MPARRRFNQTEPLGQRLSDEAERLRKQARGTPPGVERDKLIRRAKQAETASRFNNRLTAPELQPPK
jgi:hypothetical protein